MNSAFKPFLAILALVVVLAGISFFRGSWGRAGLMTQASPTRPRIGGGCPRTHAGPAGWCAG